MSSSSFTFEQLCAPAVSRATTLADATAEAERIVAAAQAEAAAVREAGRLAGLEEGRTAALSELRAELGPAAHTLSTAAAELERFGAERAAAIEREAVELAVMLAEKVLDAALEVRPEVVLDVIRTALRGLVDRERIVVQVNPEDLELVRAGIDEIAGALGGVEHLEVRGERRVSRGGAVLVTALGEVDAHLETKLARAREAMRAELGG